MGWVESNRKSNKKLIQAVKDIRAHFGDSQQAFAERIGLSKRAVLNYEQGHRPTAGALAVLTWIASDATEGSPQVLSAYQTLLIELGRDVGLGKLKGGAIDFEEGWLVQPFHGDEQKRYILAFFQTLARLRSNKPELKAKATAALDRLVENSK